MLVIPSAIEVNNEIEITAPVFIVLTLNSYQSPALILDQQVKLFYQVINLNQQIEYYQ